MYHRLFRIIHGAAYILPSPSSDLFKLQKSTIRSNFLSAFLLLEQYRFCQNVEEEGQLINASRKTVAF